MRTKADQISKESTAKLSLVAKGNLLDLVHLPKPARTFEVEIELIENLLGTVPLNKEIFSDYVEQKKVEVGVKSGTVTKEELLEHEVEFVENREERGSTGFHSDEKGLFLYNYLIGGFLAEAGNTLKDDLKIKNLKSKIHRYVKVQPRRIYLGKLKADGVFERPLRAMTAQGPRVSLIKSDVVNAGHRVAFQILVIPNDEINEVTLGALLAYGQHQGLGQFRNGGFGSFKVMRFEEV